jgi:Sec-independent protein secretion pathway component TatC
MNKFSLAIASLGIFATSALAQAPAEEPHVQMIWVWLFVALFFGSIVVVGWMMWRSEKAERLKNEAAGSSTGPTPTPHKS